MRHVGGCLCAPHSCGPLHVCIGVAFVGTCVCKCMGMPLARAKAVDESTQRAEIYEPCGENCWHQAEAFALFLHIIACPGFAFSS